MAKPVFNQLRTIDSSEWQGVEVTATSTPLFSLVARLEGKNRSSDWAKSSF